MTEGQALKVVEATAAGEGHYSVGETLIALSVVFLSHRIHMQQLKGELMRITADDVARGEVVDAILKRLDMGPSDDVVPDNVMCECGSVLAAHDDDTRCPGRSIGKFRARSG
jgi:hypothetical protein